MAGPTTAKARSGPVTTQVTVLVSLPSSSAIRGIDTDRIVIVKPTENSPNSATVSTSHGYRGLPATRSCTRSRSMSGHGTTATSSAPGASIDSSSRWLSSGGGTAARLS